MGAVIVVSADENQMFRRDGPDPPDTDAGNSVPCVHERGIGDLVQQLESHMIRTSGAAGSDLLPEAVKALLIGLAAEKPGFHLP